MKYGVSYYPEQREPAEMEQEIVLMKEAEINIVRMGEFAWCKFEPADGVYDFSWLDSAVEKLAQSGIKSIICTPTACPPAWLCEKHPEILYVDNRGVTRPFGGRRHYCYNSPVYRRYCRKIAEQIAMHYGQNPNVEGFQIDNELAQENTGRCHCDCCRDKFRGWLKDKYVTIENLNKKAGTVFWGQTYDRFEQIPLPVNTIEPGADQSIDNYYENPSIRLEYERFCSESIIGFAQSQLEIMRRYTDKCITTNGTGLATNSVNYYDGFSQLDRYAFDFYPGLRDDVISSFVYSFARGVRDSNFWVLEFVSGGGHRLNGSGRLQPYPGALKQAVLHAFANGAELLAHFQFRTFIYGAEQLNYAILDADGIPRRRFYEMQSIARELQKLEPFLNGSVIKNDVAVCFDYDTLWSTGIKPINDKSFDYLSYCKSLYDTLTGCGIGADVIPYERDFSKYRFLIVPTPFVMTQELKSRLKEYVRNGGVVLSTFLAGAKDEYNAGLAKSLPCGMDDLFGVTVKEMEPVFPATISQIGIDTEDGRIEGGNLYWLEELDMSGAEQIGFIENTFRKDECILSRNSFGSGTAYYLGTGLDDGLTEGLLKDIADKAGVTKVPFALEKGTEAVRRIYNGKPAYFIFNFLSRNAMVRLDKAYTTISGGTVSGEITLAPKGYELLF